MWNSAQKNFSYIPHAYLSLLGTGTGSSVAGSILLLFYPDVVLESRTLVISHAGIGIWDSRCKGKPLPGQHIQPTAMHKKTCQCQNSGFLASSLFNAPPPPRHCWQMIHWNMSYSIPICIPSQQTLVSTWDPQLKLFKNAFYSYFKIHCYKKWWPMFVFYSIIGQLKYFITVQTAQCLLHVWGYWKQVIFPFKPRTGPVGQSSILCCHFFLPTVKERVSQQRDWTPLNKSIETRRRRLVAL